MGLESYLFKIELSKPVFEHDIVDLFNKIGMFHLIDKLKIKTTNDFGSYFFDLKTDKGLIEANCILTPEETSLKYFSLRFSVVSPKTVIDLTFDLLKKLNGIVNINVYDTEIRNHIYRQLRKSKKVDDWFNGLEGTDEELKFEKLCSIELDADKFRTNQLGIMKRQIILDNDYGEIIESGSMTFDYIKENELYQRFIGWIVNEL